MSVPDSDANTTRFPKHRCNHGASGYPLMRVMVLVACGTRTLIDAVFGPTTCGEIGYAQRLLGSLGQGMLLLADRNFAAGKLLAAIARTGAHALIRCKTGATGPKLPRLRRLPDGSWLSHYGGLDVRVVDADISIITTSGRHTGHYRLICTLTDHHRYPAGELVKLYHERWEIETCYLEIKSSVLGGRVLRARTPIRIEQEVYALLNRLSAAAHRDRRRRDVRRDRPRPGQLHHRHQHRPRPTHPGIEHHRPYRHRSDRRHRPTGTRSANARPAGPGQPTHRQTRHLQVPSPRPEHQPHQLQGNYHHRHPRPAITLDTTPNVLTTRPWI